MKVAFFLGRLKRGGAESLVCDICKRHDSAPFGICCLYREDDDYSDEFKRSGAELIQVRRKGNIIGYIWNLRKAVLDHHIDIIHAQTPSNALVSIAALFFTPVKIVTSFHGFSFSDAPRWYWKTIYKCSKSIICVSKYEKQYYINKWKLPENNKIQVIYNGIDFSKLDCPKPSLTQLISIDENTLNMIMVGSFIKGRSQFFVCQVLHRLDQMRVPFNMYFVGRREESEYWRYDDCVSFCEQNNLTEKVRFLGNRTDVPYLLSQMDLFLYASEHDTFGIAVIEAIASGLPVVVNDWAVMKEITNDGQWATLYESNSIDDCVLQLELLIKEESIRKNDAQRIAMVVKEHFSIENHINALSKVYEKTIL